MASNQQKIILSSFSTVTPGYITLLSNRMSALAPLAMSQTKDELLKHLNMAPETYTLMAVSLCYYYAPQDPIGVYREDILLAGE